MKFHLTCMILILAYLSCEAPLNKSKNQIPQIIPIAERIEIGELKSHLKQLKKGQKEYNFFGITSNGIDCIYIIIENDKFNIEYEAMTKEQIPFIEKLKEYAISRGFETEMMTYNNEPQFASKKPAPVLKIKTNAEIDIINKIAIQIQNQIFNNTQKSIYNVVP